MGYFYDGGNPPIEQSNGSSGYIKPGNQMLYERDNEPIPMSEEMTERLWTLINENTELKHELMMVKHKLVQIKRLMEE